MKFIKGTILHVWHIYISFHNGALKQYNFICLHLLVCIRKTRFRDGPPRLIMMHVQMPAHCPGGDDVGCDPVSLQLTRIGSSSTSSKMAKETILTGCRFPRPAWSGPVNDTPWVASQPFDDSECSRPWDAHSNADGVSGCSNLPSLDNSPTLAICSFYHDCIILILRQ